MEKQLPGLVFDSLCKKSGHFYVCGDVAMANHVEKALKRIYMKMQGGTEGEAETWFQTMKVGLRFVVFV